MKLTKKTWLLLIFFLGAVIRFYQLGSIPQGFFSDEAAVGYNAFSILKTARDEFGKFLPFFFRSFGEGKLPLYVYQAVPFVWLFGPTELAVRFSGALFGSLTIIVWYLFLLQALKLTKLKQKYHQAVSLISAFSLAIMPWHIHFSRGVFGQESLFWVTFGSYLLLKGLSLNKKATTFLGFLSFTASLLIYHSPKVILPFWIPALLFLTRKPLKKLLSHSLIGTILVVLTWAIVTFHPAGMTRAKGISVFSVHSGVSAKLHESLVEEGGLNRPIWFARAMHNKLEAYGRDIAGRYLSHFNPDFLFISGDLIRPRYRVPGQAQVFAIFIPFFILGLYLSFKNRIWLPLIFLALAPLPASLSFETPSTVRALFMTPSLATLISLGLVEAYHWFKQQKLYLFRLALFIFIFGLIYQLISYFNSYFFLAQIHKPYAWQYGYKPLVKKVIDIQDNYDQIVVTGMGGPPHIFFLFYQQYDPAYYQAQVNNFIGDTDPFGFIHITGFDKYRFPKEPCPFDSSATNTLFICQGEGEAVDKKHLIDSVYFADQTPAFTIFDPAYEK